MNWAGNWRERFWDYVVKPLDVLVIGGGITGAGILHAAAQRGLRAALVEQKDFAWGSSSRSSKLVHGGLRYLKQGRFGLTRSALKERNALLQEYPDLIRPRRFFMSHNGHASRQIQAGLMLYDLLAGHSSRQQHNRESWLEQFPTLDNQERDGALSYCDAATDDCLLVMRVLQQAAAQGSPSCNYAPVTKLLQQKGKTIGAVVHDAIADQHYEVQAHVVINATGAWAEQLQPILRQQIKLRPLRGSHLVLPFHALPLTEAIGCLHPQDQRPVYAVPWAGAVLFGTTDVDHDADLQQEPHISASEYDYLMSALFRLFPELSLRERDVLSSFAGIRPTFYDGDNAPSETSREHVIQEAEGWIGISGGKLTTFRQMADAVMQRVQKQLGKRRHKEGRAVCMPICDATNPEKQPHYLGESASSEQSLHAALTTQAIHHLDDLMLRRTRIGLVAHDGGKSVLQANQTSICETLAWSAADWQSEYDRYLQIWHRAYAPQAFQQR